MPPTPPAARPGRPEPPKTTRPAPAPAGRRAGRGLPDLRSLETFVAVCECGTMALAARRLGVTQSAVSQAVRVLEAEHGTALFDRDVRPLRPTRTGTLLLELAATLLASARAVGEQLRHSARQDHPQIRLGFVDSFAATVGPALVRGLAGSARELRLWSGLTPSLNTQLRSGELDLAVCTEVPAADARLSQRLLCSEAWVAVFPPQHACPVIAEPRALGAAAGALPLIRYSQRSVIGQQVERYLRHLGIAAPRRFEFDATDPMLSLVAAGLGWAVTTPLCLWQSRAWLDQLQVAPLPETRLGRRDFHLLYRDAGWAATADEIERLTRSVLLQHTVPALRSRLPGLPPAAVTLA